MAEYQKAGLVSTLVSPLRSLGLSLLSALARACAMTDRGPGGAARGQLRMLARRAAHALLEHAAPALPVGGRHVAAQQVACPCEGVASVQHAVVVEQQRIAHLVVTCGVTFGTTLTRWLHGAGTVATR